MTKVLVVAAHPDDEVLGAGGTIARLAAGGADVHIAILGEGITSRYAARRDAEQGLLSSLHANMRQAAKVLGAHEPIMGSLPDNRFDELALLDVVKTVEEIVRRVSPDIIYTHSLADLNIDHQITGRAVLTATRPMDERRVQKLFAFEVPSSTEWAFGQLNGGFRPSTFVDITSTISRKIEAMHAYAGELRKFPHPRSIDVLEAMAKRWGSACGVHAAEAFETVRVLE